MQEYSGNIRICHTGSSETAARVQALYVQAAVLLQSGHRSDALICLHKARIIAPGCPEVLYAIGNCLSEIGQVEEASAYYREALDRIRDRLVAIGNYDISIGHYPGYRAR